METLDDLACFAHVAEHGGFAVAKRAIGVPQIQRNTRRFAVTDIGQRTLQRARRRLPASRCSDPPQRMR